MLTLDQLRDEFEAFRVKNPVGVTPKGLYEPAEYLMDLGGKRMRPLSLLVAYYIFKDDYSTAMPAALGIEVFHNFTLMHDDIMDQAVVRRGLATSHIKYGEDSAILSGDVMMIRSFDMLLQSCNSENAVEVLQLMIDTAREICEGQQYDLDFESRDDVSLEEYLEMNRLKTAVLLAASLKIGALLGGASPDDADRIYKAGEKLGTAFQVQDDLLDAYGDSSNTGKKRGGDIVQSKKTFLYAKVIEALPPMRRDSFMSMYKEEVSNPEVKIQRVLRVFDEFNIADKARQYADRAYEEGMNLLDTVGGSQTNKVLLTDFVRQLKKRSV